MPDVSIDVFYEAPSGSFGGLDHPGGYTWLAGGGFEGELDFGGASWTEQIAVDQAATSDQITEAAIAAFVQAGGRAEDVAEVSINGGPTVPENDESAFIR